MALKRYKNLGGTHYMKDQNGTKVQVNRGEVFVEDEVVIARLQQPGNTIKFQLIGEVQMEEEEPVAVGAPATPIPSQVVNQTTQPSSSAEASGQREELEAMTFEELKTYAANNMIDVSTARSKKAAVDLIMQAIQE